MPPMMDALGAFSYMSVNLPTWISGLSDLAVHTAAKHAEYTKAYKKHTHNDARPRRRRNSSVCSIRTEDIHPASQNCGNSMHEYQGASSSLRKSTSQNHLSGNPRKRGIDQASSINSADDRLPFVSTRYNVVIHYDGHTQNNLEEMVRNISTARNNIRRGKIASQMPPVEPRSNGFSRNMKMGTSPSSLMDQGETPSAQLLSNVRSARNRGPPTQLRGSRKDIAFDIADKQLEVAHRLCETAAYQFLRFGDCSSELAGVEEKFNILLELATNEVQRLKAEQGEETEPEEQRAMPVAKSRKPSFEPGDDQADASSIQAIEVDDGSSISVESIDITAFRSNRVRG